MADSFMIPSLDQLKVIVMKQPKLQTIFPSKKPTNELISSFHSAQQLFHSWICLEIMILKFSR